MTAGHNDIRIFGNFTAADKSCRCVPDISSFTKHVSSITGARGVVVADRYGACFVRILVARESSLSAPCESTAHKHLTLSFLLSSVEPLRCRNDVTFLTSS